MTTPAVRYLREVDPLELDEPVVRSLTAAGFPVKPPAAWFDDPKLERPTPLTITREGRVFGHIAPWNARHVGLPGNVRPPKSRSRYAFFNKGVVETAEGHDVSTGPITFVGGHAPLHADASRAIAHYDETRSAFADVHVGEDKHGIWAAGALRPDVDDIKLRAIRASVPSGDWRPINGGHELIAICQVNSGGFPIAEAAIAASSGEVLALVAAGAQHMYDLKLDAARGHVGARLEQLEGTVRNIRKDSLRRRVLG